MIIYALHAICRAINRTRARVKGRASNSPTHTHTHTIRLYQRPTIEPIRTANLGMHNSLQINRREPSRVWPHKMLGKYVRGWGPKCFQLATKFGRTGSTIGNKNVPRTMQKQVGKLQSGVHDCNIPDRQEKSQEIAITYTKFNL